jgi:hypothetical protein
MKGLFRLPVKYGEAFWSAPHPRTTSSPPTAKPLGGPAPAVRSGRAASCIFSPAASSPLPIFSPCDFIASPTAFIFPATIAFA